MEFDKKFAASIALDNLAMLAKELGADPKSASAKTALNELAKRVMPLMRKTALKYSRANGVDFDDALQEASIGFMLAFNKWDPKKGSSFFVHARRWMECQAKRTGMKTRHYGDVIRDPDRLHDSMDREIMQEGEATLHDVVGTDQPSQHDQLEREASVKALNASIKKLTTKYRDVVRARKAGKTHREIGQKIGKSYQTACNLEQAAHGKLRTYMRGWAP